MMLIPSTEDIYNNKVDFIEIGRIVIADFLPRSDLEKCMSVTLLSSPRNLQTQFYLFALFERCVS